MQVTHKQRSTARSATMMRAQLIQRLNVTPSSAGTTPPGSAATSGASTPVNPANALRMATTPIGMQLLAQQMKLRSRDGLALDPEQLESLLPQLHSPGRGGGSRAGSPRSFSGRDRAASIGSDIGDAAIEAAALFIQHDVGNSLSRSSASAISAASPLSLSGASSPMTATATTVVAASPEDRSSSVGAYSLSSAASSPSLSSSVTITPVQQLIMGVGSDNNNNNNNTAAAATTGSSNTSASLPRQQQQAQVQVQQPRQDDDEGEDQGDTGAADEDHNYRRSARSRLESIDSTTTSGTTTGNTAGAATAQASPPPSPSLGRSVPAAASTAGRPPSLQRVTSTSTSTSSPLPTATSISSAAAPGSPAFPINATGAGAVASLPRLPSLPASSFSLSSSGSSSVAPLSPPRPSSTSSQLPSQSALASSSSSSPAALLYPGSPALLSALFDPSAASSSSATVTGALNAALAWQQAAPSQAPMPMSPGRGQGQTTAHQQQQQRGSSSSGVGKRRGQGFGLLGRNDSGVGSRGRPTTDLSYYLKRRADKLVARAVIAKLTPQPPLAGPFSKPVAEAVASLAAVGPAYPSEFGAPQPKVPPQAVVNAVAAMPQRAREALRAAVSTVPAAASLAGPANSSSTGLANALISVLGPAMTTALVAAEASASAATTATGKAASAQQPGQGQGQGQGSPLVAKDTYRLGSVLVPPLLRLKEARPRSAIQKGDYRWVSSSGPGSAACQHCAARFTLMSRQHHCRGCGALLCNNCGAEQAEGSSAFAALAGLQRLCRPCRTVLARGSPLKRSGLVPDAWCFADALCSGEALEVDKRLQWAQQQLQFLLSPEGGNVSGGGNASSSTLASLLSLGGQGGLTNLTPLHLAAAVSSQVLYRAVAYTADPSSPFNFALPPRMFQWLAASSYNNNGGTSGNSSNSGLSAREKSSAGDSSEGGGSGFLIHSIVNGTAPCPGGASTVTAFPPSPSGNLSGLSPAAAGSSFQLLAPHQALSSLSGSTPIMPWGEWLKLASMLESVEQELQAQREQREDSNGKREGKGKGKDKELVVARQSMLSTARAGVAGEASLNEGSAPAPLLSSYLLPSSANTNAAPKPAFSAINNSNKPPPSPQAPSAIGASPLMLGGSSSSSSAAYQPQPQPKPAASPFASPPGPFALPSPAPLTSSPQRPDQLAGSAVAAGPNPVEDTDGLAASSSSSAVQLAICAPKLGPYARAALRSSEVIAVELNRQLYASTAVAGLHASLIYAANHACLDPVLLQAVDPMPLVNPCAANGGGSSGPKAFTGSGSAGNSSNNTNSSDGGNGGHEAGLSFGIGGAIHGTNASSQLSAASSSSSGPAGASTGDAVALCRVIPAPPVLPPTSLAAAAGASAGGRPASLLFQPSPASSPASGSSSSSTSTSSSSSSSTALAVYDAFALPPCVPEYSSDSARYAQKMVVALIRGAASSSNNNKPGGNNGNTGLGIDVNASSSSMGMTALHAAAHYGACPAVINALLEAGAMQAKTDANGLSAHDYASLRLNACRLALQQCLAMVAAAEQTNLAARQQQPQAQQALAPTAPSNLHSHNHHHATPHSTFAALVASAGSPSFVPLSTLQALKGCVAALRSQQQQCSEALLLLDGRYSSGSLQQHSRWLNQGAATTRRRRERIARFKRAYARKIKQQSLRKQLQPSQHGELQHHSSPHHPPSHPNHDSPHSTASSAATDHTATDGHSSSSSSSTSASAMASPLVSGRAVTATATATAMVAGLRPYEHGNGNGKQSQAQASAGMIFAAEDEDSNHHHEDEDDASAAAAELEFGWARLSLVLGSGTATATGGLAAAAAGATGGPVDAQEAADAEDAARFFASAIGNPSLGAYGGMGMGGEPGNREGDDSGEGGDRQEGAAGEEEDEVDSGEAESQARAEKLPLPPRAQLLEVGIQYLDPAAQALQANLLAVRNSYETRCSEDDWACIAAARWGDDRYVGSCSRSALPAASDPFAYGGNTRLRSQLVELGLLSPISRHELGWRKEYALVGKVWRLGHPAEADGDVAPLVDQLYRATNPSSPLLDILPIRADAELRRRYLAEEDARLEAMADGTYDPYNNNQHHHGHDGSGLEASEDAVDDDDTALDAEAEAALAAAGGPEHALEMHASGNDPRAIHALQMAQHALLMQQQKSGKKVLKG